MNIMKLIIRSNVLDSKPEDRKRGVIDANFKKKREPHAGVFYAQQRF
jgi:hypothetical protein